MTKSDHVDAITYLQQFLARVPLKVSLKIDRMRKQTVEPRWGHAKATPLLGNHVTMVHSGLANFRVNGEDIQLKRGVVLLTTTGCEQSYVQDPDDPPTVITVRFRRFSVPGGRELPPPPCEPIHFVARPQNIERFSTLMELLYDSWERCPEPIAEVATGGLLQALLWALHEECLYSESRPKDTCMEEVRLLLESEPFANWSIPDLAKRFCMSEAHLSRRFRKYTGMPPKTYQLQSRMRCARQLLRHEGKTVQETADLLGYSDAFAFSRQFKKIWGYPPSQVG